MDTTQKIKSFLAVACLIAGSNALAQPSVENIQFCDRSYQYGIGNDSIKVFFNLLDSEGKKIPDLSLKEFENNFYFNEDGKDVENREIVKLNTGNAFPMTIHSQSSWTKAFHKRVSTKFSMLFLKFWR